MIQLTKSTLKEAIINARTFLGVATARSIAEVLGVRTADVVSCMIHNEDHFRIDNNGMVSMKDSQAALITAGSQDLWQWWIDNICKGDSKLALTTTTPDDLRRNINQPLTITEQFDVATLAFLCETEDGQEAIQHISTNYDSSLISSIRRLAKVDGRGQQTDKYVYGIPLTDEIAEMLERMGFHPFTAERARQRMGSMGSEDGGWKTVQAVEPHVDDAFPAETLSLIVDRLSAPARVISSADIPEGKDRSQPMSTEGAEVVPKRSSNEDEEKNAERMRWAEELTQLGASNEVIQKVKPGGLKRHGSALKNYRKAKEELLAKQSESPAQEDSAQDQTAPVAPGQSPEAEQSPAPEQTAGVQVPDQDDPPPQPSPTSEHIKRDINERVMQEHQSTHTQPAPAQQPANPPASPTPPQAASDPTPTPAPQPARPEPAQSQPPASAGSTAAQDLLNNLLGG